MEERTLDSLSTAAIDETWIAHPRRHSQVQCDVCGSPDVSGVCHHCRKYLCARHVARPAFYEQHSWEFKTLVDPPLWSRAIHCEEHAHFVFAYRRMIVWPAVLALIATLLALLMTSSSIIQLVSTLSKDPLAYLVWVTWVLDTWFRGQPVALLDSILTYAAPVILSLCGVIVSLVVAIVGERLYQAKGIPALEREGQPIADIPYIPEYYRVNVEETVDVSFQASGERLTCDVSQGAGRVQIHALPGAPPSKASDGYNERARNRHWAFQRLPNWDIGYAALDLPEAIDWSPPQHGLGRAGNLIRLQPLAARALSAPDRKWVALSFNERYTLSENALFPGDGVDRRPFLRVLPVLQPLSAGRTVLLLFELAPSLTEAKWVLSNLTLDVPTGAFDENNARLPVEETNGFIDMSRLQVRWTRLPLTGTSHQCPSVTFAEPAPSLRRPLKATFEIEGDRALSDLVFGDGRIWLPTGAAVAKVQVIKRHTTTIRGTVAIDPALLSYQCELATAPIAQTLPGVALAPAVLSRVLTRRAAEDVMVYAVTQNTDTISSAEGRRIVSWDIWGRQYVEVYPMDVHILLTGRAPSGNDRAESSFTVTGRVLMNSQFEEFEVQVQRFAEGLSQIVREELT